MSTQRTPTLQLVEDDDTLDDRRRRGEIACAECRRLKIKCDKTVPCGSCVRRNCAELCPNGANTTADGTRVVIDATGHLHQHIAAIRDRIRALQGALAEVHGEHSNDPHPLLATTAESSSEDDDVDEDPELAALTGAITDLEVADDGSTVFFGTAPSPLATPANTATLSAAVTRTARNLKPLHSEFLRCIYQFPFPLGGLPVAEIVTLLKTYLPPYDVAHRLVHAYFTQFPAMFHGIPPEQVTDILCVAYSFDTHESAKIGYSRVQGNMSSHELALLFDVLAMGSYVMNPPDERTSVIEHYAQLSLAALGAMPITENPTLVTVQAMHMHAWSAIILQNGNEEVARAHLAIACQLCYTLGLHRDPRQWSLPPDVCKQRIAVFWMVYIADMWESLSSGRAPRLASDAIDCPPPDDFFMGSLITEGRELIAELIACTVAKEPPSYAHVLDLDARLRHLGTLSLDRTGYPMLAVLLLYLHRAFFALALKESPSDPMNSTYRISFEATVRSVRAVMDWLIMMYRDKPDVVLCFAYEWATGVTAAVVYASLVTSARGSHRNAALTVLHKMDELVKVYESASARGSGRATHALPTMRSLYEKARRHLEQQSAATQEQSGEGMPWALDELLGKGSPQRASPSAESDTETRSSTPPQPKAQGVNSSPGKNQERASSSAYPKYLSRSRRPSPSSRAKEAVPPTIIPPEVPFVAYPYGTELSTEGMLSGPGSLVGQWDAHVRRESVV